MKIAMVGTGHVGSSLASLFLRANHEVRFGSRQSGPPADGVRQDTVFDAAARAELVVVAVPFGTWPQLARELLPCVREKIVVDASNPSPHRDGEFAQRVLDAGRGSGIPIASLIPNAKLIRAFNSIAWPASLQQANLANRIAIPFAGDDAVARSKVAQLIRDVGFEPVDAGTLEAARLFDPGQPAYNHPMPASEMRRVLFEGLMP